MNINKVYRENLLYLDMRCRTLARRIRAARRTDTTSLGYETARTGVATVRVTTSVGTYPLHSAYDPEKEASVKTSCDSAREYRSSIVFGVGLGYHIVKLLASAHGPVIVVEPSVRVFAAFLGHMRLATIAGVEQCEFFVGNIQERTVASLSQRIASSSPGIRTVVLDGAASAFPQAYAAFSGCVQKMQQQMRLQYDAFHDQITVMKERYRCGGSVDIATLCTMIAEQREQHESLPLERVFIHYYHMARLYGQKKR